MIQGDDGTHYISYSSAGTLTNDGGTWSITCAGSGHIGASSEAVIYCWYEGRDGYDGLTAFTIEEPRNEHVDGTWDLVGWIYPGDPPPALTFEP